MKDLKKKQAFKICGAPLEAVHYISSNTFRTLTSSIEYLIMAGFTQHEKDMKTFTSKLKKEK